MNTTSSLPLTESLSDPTLFAILAFMMPSIVAMFLLLFWGLWLRIRPRPEAPSPTSVAPSEGEMTTVVYSEGDMAAFMYQPLNAFQRLNG